MGDLQWSLRNSFKLFRILSVGDRFVSEALLFAEGIRQREGGPMDRSAFSDECLASEASAKASAVGDNREADGAESSLRVADSSKLCCE